MGRIGEQIYRKRLHRFLSRADDLAFLRMLWAVGAIQDGRAQEARPFLNFPTEAVTDDLASRFAIYPWELELLANEVLTVPKEERKTGRILTLDCSEFSTTAQICRTVRKLENAEYGTRSKRLGILIEMHRIGQRQFEWQRGFFNKAEFYRAARVYGGPHVDRHFQSTHGLQFHEFTKFGFAVHSALLNHPGINPMIDMTQIGIGSEIRDRGFQLITLPLAEARTEAKRIRRSDREIAYRPSILRRWPIIEITKNSLALCPIVSLLAQRISSGVFYDLLGASGEVWDEVGERFESYAKELLTAILTTRSVLGESTFRVGKNLLHTPDILVSRNGDLELIIECKAKRMTFEAKFGSDPIQSAVSGYNEMARAVLQIWRYVRDRRTGLVDGAGATQAIGLVLTLDNWLSSAKELQEQVIQQAHTLADADARAIIDEDRIPVSFTSIHDLEVALSDGSDESLMRTMRALADEYRGWLLPLAQNHFSDEQQGHRDLPFINELSSVLPWWSELE